MAFAATLRTAECGIISLAPGKLSAPLFLLFRTIFQCHSLPAGGGEFAHIVRLGRRGTGLVGLLNEVSGAVEHEFGSPAVQCESQAPPDLLEEDGLACPAMSKK